MLVKEHVHVILKNNLQDRGVCVPSYSEERQKKVITISVALNSEYSPV